MSETDLNIAVTLFRMGAPDSLKAIFHDHPLMELLIDLQQQVDELENEIETLQWKESA